MTDSGGEHGTRGGDAGRTSRVSTARTPSRGAKRAEPTEPEVPTAKRVRAVHRQRSTWTAGAAIAALFVLVLALLYKTGRQVTSLQSDSKSASPVVLRSPRESTPPAAASGIGNGTSEAPAASTPRSVTAEDDVIVLPRSTVTRGAAAPRAKPSAQSSGIFRKPAF
jgi:hypothetical protein